MIVALVAAAAFQTAKQVPAPIWGVTIDDLGQLDDIVAALGKLRAKPTARIVFDPSVGPSYYAPYLPQLTPVANLMGEPIDSSPPSGQMTVSAYVSRMKSYMTALSSSVGLWEIGNEVNGDWTCASTEMASKISGTLSVAESLHLKTALTLFYSPDYFGTDRDMVKWSQKYLSSSVRSGINYVLVSYYPTTVSGGPYWPGIFRQLAQTFPNAYVGFGELGLANSDGTLNTNPNQKKALIQKMYGASTHMPGRYINGFFWWTFVEDAVPAGTGLWSTFYNVIH